MSDQIIVPATPKELTPSVPLTLSDSADKPTAIRMMLAPSAGMLTISGRITGGIVALSDNEYNQVRERVAGYRRLLGNPVSIGEDGQIHLSEYAMIPERPYVVNYSGDVYEFVRTADGKIVVSEVKLAE